MKTIRRILLGALLILASLNAYATHLVQEFFVPLPEDQVQKAFKVLYSGVGAQMNSVISIEITANNTIINYDHWEDGYEVDLENPTQSTTEIWGDGNDANGIPPGFAHDPVGLTKGTVISLRNTVDLPRNPAVIRYDGRDRIGASIAVVASRAEWATNPGTVLAGAAEMISLRDYGTDFKMPVGQNLSAIDNSMFNYVGMLMVAAQDGTNCTYTDVNNVITTLPTLNTGSNYQLNGGVKAGDHLSCNNPVQVHLITGRINGNYESRWYMIYPTTRWSSDYYTPAGTSANNDTAYVFVFNPDPTNSITVNYETLTGTGSFSVAANSTSRFQMPVSSGGHFYTSGANFYAVAAMGATPTANNVHDWGFLIVPKGALTTEAVAGWAPGNGNLPPTDDGSPLWVTAPNDTTVYVDYHGDGGPNTAANGQTYDVAVPVKRLQSVIIAAPNHDNTGTRLFTTDGTLVSAAWGQNSAVAGPGAPYLDMGTAVLPFPVPSIVKTAALMTSGCTGGSNDTNGIPAVNECLHYTLTVDNAGLTTLDAALLQDDLGSGSGGGLTYQPGTAMLNGTPIPDGPGNSFPLAAPGYLIEGIPPGASSTVTYDAKITWAGATPHSLTNNAFLNNPNISGSYTVILPPTVAAACNLNFTNSGGTTVTTYSVGDTLYVKLSDADLAGSGTTTVLVTNPADGSKDTETLTLTETSSGVFTGSLPSSSTAGQTDNDGTLFMQVGDAIQVASSYPTCSAATANVPPPTKTKTLYLTGVAQNLTRTVPTNVSATSTATLNTGSTATIAIGGTTTGSSSGTNATSLTFSHTAGSGSNRLLLVSVATGSPNNTASAGTVSSVKFNGVTMTLLGSALNGGGGTTGVNAYIYYLKDASINTSSAANVVITTTSSTIAASATTFTGVDQTTPLGAFASNTGDSGTVALASAYTSATGEVVYSIGANEQGTTNRSITTSTTGGQVELWNVSSHTYVDAATSTKPGAASVSPTYTLSTTRYWAMGAVSLKPATTVGNPTATFTQTPTMASGLTIPAGATLAARAYYTVATGSMPASPSITATLKYGATTIATSSSASASATTGSGLLTFTFPAQAGSITVPSGQAITLDITTAQSGVTFTVNYDGTSSISKVDIPTTTVITVDSLALYDGPYPGGSVVTTANNGQTLYVRSTVSDPFGAYDITSEDLAIDGPGSSCDLTPTLGAGNVVNTTTTSKTYEYAWSTAACEGAYTVTATAHEGTEGTVTATDSTEVNLSALDTGTPGIIQFVDGSGADMTSYTTSQQVCLKVTDLDQAGRPEPIQAYVTGSISGAQSAFTLTETPANSGVFKGCFGSSGSSSPFVNGDVLNASYTDPNDPSDVATDTALVTNGAVPALILTKTRIAPADGVAIVGESVQYNISVTNPGASALATVTLSDTYSSSCYTFQSASLTPDTNTPGTLAWNNVGPIAGGATVNLSVTLTAKAACDSTAATNSVSASGSASAGPATATATLNNPAVTVAKTRTSASTANIGDNVTFHIVVTNSGNTNLTTVPLSDNYSSCLQYVSATPAATSAGGGTALWSNLGALTSGSNTTVDTTFKVVGACASAQNTAEVDFAVDVNGDTAVPGSGSDTVTTQAASISGQVVNDNGAGGGIVGDGIKNGTESGIAGVNIKLYLDPNGDGDPSDAGSPVAVTTTDASGNYSILGLALDTGSARYVIVETDPAGYQSTSPLSNKLIVDVSAIQDYPNEDFFDVRPDISGQVRNDVDDSGNLADADSGIPGVTVTLYTDVNSNGIYDSGTDTVFGSPTTTDANGNYRFFGVPAGHYVVVETDPADMVSTNDKDGNSPIANGFNTIAINFAPAAPSNGNDFLDFLPTYTVTGTVYDDNGGTTGTAADGLQDGDEAGTNGGGLYALLVDGSSNVAASTAVAGNGAFSFGSIENGSYTVRLSTVAGTVGNAAPAESVPSGWVDTGESLTNAANDGVADGNLAVTVSGAAVSGLTLGMRQVADVLLDKNGPAVAGASGTVNYTMRVYNAGPATANNSLFSDAVPSGLTGMTWYCVAAGGAACPNASGSGAIAETIATFPAGGELTYSATGTAPASGSVTNSATVSTPAGLFDPDTGNNSDAATTLIGTVGTTADLAVVKTGPSSVAANGALSYVMSVTNAGPAAANGAVFSDAAPSGLTGMAWSCVAAGGALCPNASGSGAISETIAAFPAGGSLNYTVSGTAPASGTVTNSATVTAPGGVTDPDSSNNTDTASTDVAAMIGNADLAIAKRGPSTVTTGGAVSYTLLVSNAGPDAVTGASVVDAVPAALTSVSWTCGGGTGGGSCDSGNGSGSIDTTVNLPAGATVTLTVSGTAPATGAFVNSAKVIPPVGTNDPDPGNNLGGPVITEVSTATLSGVVFNDDGAGSGTAADGVQNGTEPGLNAGGLNVVVVDGSNTVLAVAAVASDGTWSAVVPTGSGYSAFITTANPSVGATLAPSATLPADWAVTGESSDGSSSDGTPDGILTGIDASASAGTFEFGIRSTLADMGVALSGLSSAGAPGATDVEGTVTCTNYGPAAAENATCSASTVTPGASVSMGSCTASSGSAASLPVDATLTCPFTITMPGTAGGSDTSETDVAISASTDADNEGGATSNSDSGSVPLIDAVDDTTATLTQAGGTVSVLGNDTVGSAAAAVGTNISAPTITLDGGLSALTVNGSNQLAVPAATTAGTYTVTYQICAYPAATPAACDTASVDIKITASINPVTESGSVTAGTGGTAISNVAGNDTVNGSAATLGGGGNATVAESGSWTTGITLDTVTGAINVDSTVAPGVYYETYQLCDLATPTPNCATVQDTVTVNTVAVPPLANNDSATTNYGVAVTLPILANDAGGVDGAGAATALDPATVDLDPATAGQQTSLTLTGIGAFTLNTITGAVTFTPVAGFYGTASIPYTVQDNLSPTPQTSNPALITVTVAPSPGAGIPAPPVANDDFATTSLNTPVDLPALANDASGLDGSGTATTLDPATVDLDTSTPGTIDSSITTAEGSWTVNTSTGVVTFTPTAGFTGTATLPYTVQDNLSPTPQTSNAATLTVIVSGGSTPVASPDIGSMKVTDASVTLAVLDNDVASSGAFLNPVTVDLDTVTAGIQGTMSTAEGDWVANADGTVTFVPASDYNSTGYPFTGTATLTYAVTDSSAQTAQSTISVVVTPVAVTAQDDTDSTAYDTDKTVDVAGNDSAAPSATLDPSTVTLTGSGTGGVWTSNHDGTVTFNPDSGFTGQASVTYQISDSLGNIATATVTITVANPGAPVATDDSGTTPVNTALDSTSTGTGQSVNNATILTNDTGTGITLTSVTGNGAACTSFPCTITTSHGQAVVAADGTYDYTPTSGYSGPDSYTYQITDAATQTANGTVNLSVRPTAADDGPVSVTFNTALNDGGASILTNDTGSTLTVSSVTGNGAACTSFPCTVSTNHGSVTVQTTGTFSYTPALDYVGADSFTYVAQDGSSQSTNSATVSFNVAAPGAPAATDDSGTTPANTALDSTSTGTGQSVNNATILTNDTGTGITLTSVTGNGAACTSFPCTITTSHGQAVVAADGTYDYTPTSGYSGPDSFTYQITDAATQTANGTVNLSVTPTAADDGPVSVTFNTASNDGGASILTNDTGSTLTVSSVTGNGAACTSFPCTVSTNHGSVTVQTTGTFSYTPSLDYVGTDSFTYVAQDGSSQSTNSATVSFNVAAPGAPVATDDSGTTPANTALDSTSTGTGQSVNNASILTNDTGTGITLTSVTGNGAACTSFPCTITTSHGQAVVASDGTYGYTPTSGYSGPDSYTYLITDAASQTASGTVNLTVTPSAANTGSISGHVWYDANNNNVFDSGEAGRPGWTVELMLGSNVISTTTTASDGSYSFTGLADGTYSIIFSTIGTAGLVPVNGEGGSPVADGGVASPSMLSGIVITGGAAVPGQGLPVDPSGVVYDSHTRQPVAGAVVTLSGPVGFSAVDVAGGSLSTITSSNGAYAFILLNTAPGGTYSLSVSRGGYKFPSATIHPSNATTDAYSGGNVSGVNGAPSGNQSTKYYISFPLPTQDMTDNNIPLDPRSLIPVPSISAWGKILLSFLMGLAGVLTLRRRRL